MSLNVGSLSLNISSLYTERHEFFELLLSFVTRKLWVLEFMNRPRFWLLLFASHTPFSGVEKIAQSSWHPGEYNAVIKSSLKFAPQCSTPIMSLVVGCWTLTHYFSTTWVTIFNDKAPKIGQYALEYSITTIQIFFNDKTKILQRHDILHQQAFLLLNKSWLCRFRDFQRQDMLRRWYELRLWISLSLPTKCWNRSFP